MKFTAEGVTKIIGIVGQLIPGIGGAIAAVSAGKALFDQLAAKGEDLTDAEIEATVAANRDRIEDRSGRIQNA